jgi:hypothetical protein
MPPSVSVGTGGLSWTPAVPSNETWVKVIGKSELFECRQLRGFRMEPAEQDQCGARYRKKLAHALLHLD